MSAENNLRIVVRARDSKDLSAVVVVREATRFRARSAKTRRVQRRFVSFERALTICLVQNGDEQGDGVLIWSRAT
jgi:hypothetical protein